MNDFAIFLLGFLAGIVGTIVWAVLYADKK